MEKATMRLKHSFLALAAAAALAGCQASTNDAPPDDSGGAAKTGAAQAGTSQKPSRTSEATRPRPVEIPEGTELTMALESSVSSATNHAGDTVVAKLSEPVQVNGKVVVPAGSRVVGKVTAALRSGRVKGRARLAMSFDSVEWHGHRAAIDATAIDITADSSKKHDAAVVGVGAGAGALIGGILKGGKGAAIGAAIGAGAGGGTVLATRGKEVNLEAGQLLKVRLTRTARAD